MKTTVHVVEELLTKTTVHVRAPFNLLPRSQISLISDFGKPADVEVK